MLYTLVKRHCSTNKVVCSDMGPRWDKVFTANSYTQKSTQDLSHEFILVMRSGAQRKERVGDVTMINSNILH